ncbi:DUF4179 domain-containing protein [Psychrobacillus sp.]|uniref:DUF4179 domain-containing protein n=1 Tax=Psychrobacillus sp. TaxID=1871623 RepID=UPI0028BF1324|nr:DUF4179 domain-containing protein [Psychrobacillus sp.]
MFEEEEKKLEQWKKSIDQVEMPMEKLNDAVRNGFEKAKNERTLKKRIIKKRSVWSLVIAAILLISFVTSISVSPTFAKTVAAIPGMDRVVALIKQDKGLNAAVENDFYQPLNLSQEKNGITVTLDGVIADRKGIIVFYSVHSEEVDLSSLYLKYYELWSGMQPQYRVKINRTIMPLTPKKGMDFFSMYEQIDRVRLKEDLSWKVGVQYGDKIENFKIPFTYKPMDVESKDIFVNKEVTIEGQRITVKMLIVDPVRTTVILEENHKNSKKLLSSRAFDELKLVDEKGRTWSAMTGNSYKSSPEGHVWEIPLQESFYFHDPEKLTLSFGKITAMDKEEAYILIDTESEKIIKEPSESIFSNLQVKDGKASFSINSENGIYNFFKFVDADGKEFAIHYKEYGPAAYPSYYVEGRNIKISENETKFEFEIPTAPFTNPIRLDINQYPSWIEEEVEVEIK